MFALIIVKVIQYFDEYALQKNVYIAKQLSEKPRWSNFTTFSQIITDM